MELSSLSALYNDANLQGYWKLESDGTDLSGNNYTVAAGTAPTFTTGLYGNGADFESGSSQYLTLADASCPALEISGSQTWSCWVKVEALANMHPMGKSPNAAANYKRLFIVSTGTVGFTLTGLTTNVVVTTPTASVVAGVWNHICGVYDSTNSLLKIFVNGEKTQVAASGSAADTNGDFSIGRLGTWTGGEFMDGVVDDCAIFDRALTDAEVRSIWGGVSYIDSGTNSATTGTAATVTKPSGAATGDLVILAIHTNGPRTTVDNNGATPFSEILVDRTYNGPSAQVDLYYRVLTGAEGASFAFTTSASDRWNIICAVFRNVASTIWDVQPTATTENTGTGSTNTTDNLVTTFDGSMAIAFAVNDSNTLTFSATPADGYISRQNNSGEQLMAMSTKSITKATTQAAVSWTQSGSNGTWLNNHFALKATPSTSVKDIIGMGFIPFAR